VVILNDAAVRRFWPGEDPLGRRISFNFGEPRWLTIVGVVGNVKHGGLEAESNPEAYLPFLQSHFPSQARSMMLAVRASGDAPGLSGLVRAAVASVDPEQPPPHTRAMAELIAASVAPRRLNLGLLLAFALVALALTAEGLYGVMAYLVLQRTREIGVRMALGASVGHVVSLVLRQTGSLALAGIGLGALLALGLSRFVASQLFGIAPTEPLVYVATSGLLLAVALVAVAVPVWRAVRVDPLVALRESA
jgi:putative ABC transport system permease protein